MSATVTLTLVLQQYNLYYYALYFPPTFCFHNASLPAISRIIALIFYSWMRFQMYKMYHVHVRGLYCFFARFRIVVIIIVCCWPFGILKLLNTSAFLFQQIFHVMINKIVAVSNICCLMAWNQTQIRSQSNNNRNYRVSSALKSEPISMQLEVVMSICLF